MFIFLTASAMGVFYVVKKKLQNPKQGAKRILKDQLNKCIAIITYIIRSGQC